MRIAASALKHGCHPNDIMAAVSSAPTRARLGEDPDRWLYIGLDAALRPLEIVSIIGDDGGETVIHAMPLRKRYLPNPRRSR